MSQAGLLNISDGNIPGNIPIVFQGNTGPGASAVANLIYIEGGVGATVDTTGQNITINVSGTGFKWNIVTAAMNPVTLVSENGYIANGLGVVNFVLPPLSAVGDSYWIKGRQNLWTLEQNAGQFISIGNSNSTLGVFGSVSATMVSDALYLLCVNANVEFTEIGVQGNLFIV